MHSSPCPKCKIYRASQTRAECKDEVYQKLEAYIGAKYTVDLKEENTFAELGFDQFTARRFWSEFWIASDIPIFLQPGHSLENLLPDENFPEMPKTVRDFIDQVANERKGTSYLACDECWVPG